MCEKKRDVGISGVSEASGYRPAADTPFARRLFHTPAQLILRAIQQAREKAVFNGCGDEKGNRKQTVVRVITPVQGD